MGKTFTYTRQIGPEYYSEQTDETFCDTEDFDYEVDDTEVSDAVEVLIYQNYFSKCGLNDDQKTKVKKAIKSFISDFDLSDALEEGLEEELKDYFESDAFSSLDD